ncbi:MAG: 4-diphosphocytidyl-2-C-methyl-D-erythritol kinase [Fimbriimonadaceae bacterium]|nr:4-diphosphocytidyl-2-C-methyl-D-erythritol kinase [Fimbriimonadaceae bacterium]
MPLTVRCPAKINRFLSVGPPEPNGFHPIRTIFQAISLADTLTIAEAGKDRILCTWNGLPSDNTLTKVLRLAREFTDVPFLQLELDKQIPAESGLGGGSSDAGGLLRALPRFTDGRLTASNLREIAAAVGKDVPFFLEGGAAQGTGYGETVDPLPNRPVEHVLIVRPDVGVSTQQAYAALDSKPRIWRDFPDEHEPYNDFERVAPCECLDLAERLRRYGATEAQLCGSGSAVYGVFASEQNARAAEERARHEGYDRAWAARTLTREESLWMSWS